MFGIATFGLKLAVKIGLPIAIIAGVVLFLAFGIQDSSLEKFTLTGISNINTESFTFNGELAVNNPSNLPVPIQSITYDVILNETGEQIGSGSISAFTLQSGMSEIPFEQKVNWAPTAQSALSLLTDDEVIITVKGTLQLGIPIINNYQIPFSKNQEITEYVKQFLPVNAPSINNEVVDDTTNQVDKVTDNKTILGELI